MEKDYQQYYEPSFQFEDDPSWRDLAKESCGAFVEMGFEAAEAQALAQSGYCTMNDMVIDRYYGGPIAIPDNRTRWQKEEFRQRFSEISSTLPLHRVHSLQHMHDILRDLNQDTSGPLLYRGQTAHYALQRRVPNAAFLHRDLGEPSLLPSVWRRVLAGNANLLHDFVDLTMFEWSSIIYALYNVQQIVEQDLSDGNFGHFTQSAWPFDDDPEPMSKFQQKREAFLQSFGLGGNPVFQTLLQHYGLYSPVLDLSSDLDVALFFATHRFSRSGDRCRYDFLGTNDRKAVIYIFRQSKREMLTYEREAMLEDLNPQRPKRQACVVAPTSCFAMNLPADFLVAVLRLDFDMAEPGRYGTQDLFPDASEDPMLAAFKGHLHPDVRSSLTEF